MIHFICTAGSWDLEKSSDLPRIPGESSDFNLAVSLLGLALDGSPSLSAPCHLACESCHLGCCCHTSLRLESSRASSQELSLSHFILVTLSSPRTCLAEAASVQFCYLLNCTPVPLTHGSACTANALFQRHCLNLSRLLRVLVHHELAVWAWESH